MASRPRAALPRAERKLCASGDDLSDTLRLNCLGHPRGRCVKSDLLLNFMAMKISRSATARAKARELFAQREEVLGYLLSAIERQQELDPVIGFALNQLAALNVSKTELSELTGLPASRVRALMKDAPSKIDGVDFGVEVQEDKDEPAPQDSSDNDGDNSNSEHNHDGE